MTGRKFECIGINENAVFSWNKQFTIGKIYDEYKLLDNKQKTLWLKGNDKFNIDWYVDEDQFKEVE